MSEIGKLYENAEIEPDIDYICDIGPDGSRSYDRVEGYPEFTAEKQIELIKLIANSKGYPDYEHFGNLFDDHIQLLEFDETLARLVNFIWQDLTEEEHKQIKKILEAE